MMTLWCMFRSPLMIGAELTLLDEWTLSLLTNTDILAMMKETCQGTQILRTEEKVIWKNKDNEAGKVCVALFNISDADATISIALNELEEDYEECANKKLYELWEKKESSTVDGKIEANVPAHGVKVYCLSER